MDRWMDGCRPRIIYIESHVSFFFFFFDNFACATCVDSTNTNKSTYMKNEKINKNRATVETFFVKEGAEYTPRMRCLTSATNWRLFVCCLLLVSFTVSGCIQILKACTPVGFKIVILALLIKYSQTRLYILFIITKTSAVTLQTGSGSKGKLPSSPYATTSVKYILPVLR